MNDRELLEMAAKAAGVTGRWHPAGIFRAHSGWFDLDWFNPLTDDGDALRLAAKLNLCIDPGARDTLGICVCPCQEWLDILVEQPIADDLFAAWRCAIVRAAAAIGEAMP